MSAPAVVVTGVGVYVSGIHSLDHFLEAATGAVRHTAPQDDPSLPWKAMRYKDRATRLALAAAHSAFEHAALPIGAADQIDGDHFGVVVSSNLGNVDTVCRVLDTIRAGGVGAASAMDLPNCSSNVIASTLAICLGLRGLNLMLCNGATSGSDALYIATTALRAGRASRMLVVGVEAGTRQAVLARARTDDASHASPPLGDGAAAVVLETAAAAAGRGREPLPWPGGGTLDLSRVFGDLYGAEGVMQAVAATLSLGRAAVLAS